MTRILVAARRRRRTRLLDAYPAQLVLAIVSEPCGATLGPYCQQLALVPASSSGLEMSGAAVARSALVFAGCLGGMFTGEEGRHPISDFDATNNCRCNTNTTPAKVGCQRREQSVVGLFPALIQPDDSIFANCQDVRIEIWSLTPTCKSWLIDRGSDQSGLQKT